MSTLTTVPPTVSSRFPGWRPILVIMGALLIAFSMMGILAPSSAQAAVVSVGQCNAQGPGPGGATTLMNCDITVVNTINGPVRNSVVTVSRVCANDPCGGTSSQSYSDVVTAIDQCNGSDNDAAHPINCNVSVTNYISADTPGAEPLSAATSNECVGSGTGGGGIINCVPFPATTTGATVTQCNGSGNGGGGTVHCTVPGSTISAAIPIQINQCNGTGNPGGSVVTCSANLSTVITPAVGPSTSPTSAPASVTPTTATPTAPGTLGVLTPTSPGTLVGATPSASAQVQVVPVGGVQTGGGSTSGLQHAGLLLVGVTMFLGAGFSASLRRRFTRRG